MTDEIINSLPPSSVNNSRAIVRGYKEKFRQCPCDYHKEKLESVGYTVDFSTTDLVDPSWDNENENDN